MIYPSNFEHKVGFDSVRAELLGMCPSGLSQRLVDEMSFTSDFNLITMRLECVNEMTGIIRSDNPLPLDPVRDVHGELHRLQVPGTFPTIDDLSRIRLTLQATADVSSYFSRQRSETGVSPWPRLDAIAHPLAPYPHLCDLIDRTIDRYGNIRDNASPALYEIRRSMQSLAGSVNSVMRRVIARAVSEGYLDKEAAPTIRDGRLVLPVAPMNKRRINGIVHDESASGRTVFIEPAEIVETNNRIRELKIDERHEIARILQVIADEMRPEIPSLLDTLAILGELEFITVKAKFAIKSEATMPRISDTQELEWYHACHPVLRESLERQGKSIVPLDITLTPDRRILIISGPNAGGKSVCLKTVGIIQYMMQCGLMPPVYENSCMGIFPDMFIDIGDDQSLEDDLSTYSSHLKSMRNFLSRGSSASLALIDEFGAGTEPQIGGALAQAILHAFVDKGMWGVITTHFQNLKHFAKETPGLVNGSMLYDRGRMQPLFKLSIGNPGSSFALEIARNIGLPPQIISEAENIVGSDYVNMDKYLLDIARDKRYWENKRNSIRIKEKKIDETLERYEHDAEQLHSKRREIIAEAQREARIILEQSNAAVENVIHDIKKANAEREKTLEARRRLNEQREKLLSEDIPETKHPLLHRHRNKKSKDDTTLSTRINDSTQLKAGDFVKLDGNPVPGEILEINGNKAAVAFGNLKTTVNLDRLRLTQARPKSATKDSFVSSSTTDEIRRRQLSFKQEIDVRGMRASEAVQAVTYFIDDALQFNASRVRILHGTGTGALRQYIRQYLGSVAGVRSCRDEDVRFGGAGITVVDLI